MSRRTTSTGRTRVAIAAGLLLLVPASATVAQVEGLTGTLIVTNKAIATATILDVASGRTLATLPTGAGPHEIALSASGNIAVITDYGAGRTPGHTLTVIDVPGLRVARTVELGRYARPHGIAFLAGDTLVAVTSEASRMVVLVNVATGVVVKAIDTTQDGSHMLAVTGDGARIYTGNITDNTVSALDVATGRTVRLFHVPAQPEAINVTADGREVWVGSNATGLVSVVDTGTGEVRTAGENFGWPYRILFSPDERTVLVPDLRRNELRFFDRADLRELGNVPFGGAGPQGISVSPDGRFAFLSLSTLGKVAILDLPARRVAGELATGETPDGVVYTTRVFTGR